MSNTPQIRFAGFTDAWEQRKLIEIVKSIDTGKSKFQSDSNNGEFAILGSTSIIGYDECFDYDGDFILTARVGANAGSLYRYTGKAKISDNTVFIQAEKNTEYVYYMLTKFDIKQLSFGTGQPLVKASELKNLDLKMPTQIEEQHKIGSFFFQLDNLITLHQRKCDALQKFKKSMLQKMFPKNGESVPEIRFAGFTDAWEQRELSDLIEENQKPVPKPDGEYIRLGIRSHAKGTFHEVVAAGEGLDVDTMYVVEANNLIVNITFAWEEAWAITSEKDAEKLVSHRFPQYRFHHDQYPMFYQYRFRNGRMKYNLELASPGGAGRNRVLNKTEFMKIPVTIPTSYEEEKKIGDLFANLDNLITLHQRKLETLQKMKKSLLQKMFV